MVEIRIENFSSKVLRMGSLVGGCQGTSGEVGCSSSGKTTTSRDKEGKFSQSSFFCGGKGAPCPASGSIIPV